MAEAGASVTNRDVTKQELAAHLFAPVDGPFEDEARNAIRAVWSRCCDLLGTAEPVLHTGLPAENLDAIPVPSLAGSVVVSASENSDRTAQVVVRREQNLLNLSVLIGAAADRQWPDCDRLLDRVLGPDTEHLLGIVRLYLGTSIEEQAFPAGTTDWSRLGGGLIMAELASVDDSAAERRFTVLSRPGEDTELGWWTWSDRGSAALPRLARYLMHVAKIRYQVRVRSGFDATAALRERVDDMLVPAPPGRLSEIRSELAATTASLRAMRRTVDTAWSNAAAALASGPDGTVGQPFAQDSELVDWFIRQLDSDVGYWSTFGEGIDRMATAERVTIEVPDDTSAAQDRRSLAEPLQILTIADEWLPLHGGPSTLNRALCVALSAAGATVSCLVPEFSPAETNDATAAGVTLVPASRIPGMSRTEAMLRKPNLPHGNSPDVVIGHGRVTGPMARGLVDDYYPDAMRLHVVHAEADRIEWHRLDSADDADQSPHQRVEIELDLAQGADIVVAIGPLIDGWLRREMPARTRTPPHVLRLDPGFDSTDQDTRSIPDGVPQILTSGRIADQASNGLDIAAKAIGQAITLRAARDDWELLIRGVPADESDEMRATVSDWIGHRRVTVTLGSHATELTAIGQDLRRSSLVVLPSRSEGFSLLGMAAVLAGTPVLVSDRSGLGMLLREVLPRDEVERVLVTEDGNEKVTVSRWSHHIGSAMSDRRAAFADAVAVRHALADNRTWSSAAAHILTEVQRTRT